jgi:predicted SnoaL-like aldol condensation-catalyzing enzyme
MIDFLASPSKKISLLLFLNYQSKSYSMKNLSLLLVFILMLTLISCETATDENDTTVESGTTNGNLTESEQAKLDAFNTVSNAFETGDVSKIDNVVAEDFLDHTDRGDVRGRDSLKAVITLMYEKMKDSKTEVVNQAVSGDYVYAWMRYSGNSDGSMGMPAGPYDMNAIEVVKFNSENKATEHWAFMEIQDMMKMMPPPAPSGN